ncbi:hypothetical protein [Oceanobacillus sp. Castelsardo]|uniref:hypothetical protein n=1 Tax=Oceanobacillus sp. Castelsardo TaxID=1851204 RepID=UPI000838925B|nr:hypothetical protein [Oceanobacillus sp. Castelsardo]
MERVRVTKEQAEAIEYGKKHHSKTDLIKTHIFYKGWSFVGELKKLNNLDLDTFIKALYTGYEVKPEFKENDYITNTETGVTMKLDESKAYFINNSYIHKEKLRHATPQEIKEEKERRFWKSHDREVNEYRKGDIFKVINNFLVLGEVESVWDNSVEDEMGDSWDIRMIKLVCPVEKRLDVNEDE